MSYRDDVDAVYQRAVTLQREVDELRAQLATRSSSVEAERQKAQIAARLSKADLERELEQLEARAVRAEAERQRAVRDASALKTEVETLKVELQRAVTSRKELDRLRTELDSRSSAAAAEREQAQAAQAELERKQAQLEARAIRTEVDRQKAVAEAGSLRTQLEKVKAELERVGLEAQPPARATGAVSVPPHMREREQPVWLPPTTAGSSSEPSAAPSGDEQLGLLVARLTVAEHGILRRLLEILGEDDFSVAAIRRNWRTLDELVVDLRLHLATRA